LHKFDTVVYGPKTIADRLILRRRIPLAPPSVIQLLAFLGLKVQDAP
jgi:hypothetical protein